MTTHDRRRGRFPLGLTLAAAVGLAILVGLGVWQLQRLKWKQDLLARIEALQGAKAQPLGAVLARAAAGQDVAFTRVTALCAPSAPVQALRYGVREGQVIWRLLSVCRLDAAPYDAIVLDRGVVGELTGVMAPQAVSATPPGLVTGVLRSPGGPPLLGGESAARVRGVRAIRVVDRKAIAAFAAEARSSRPAPYLLAVEQEVPPPLGVLPVALPGDIPNRHLEYALTWFGLAGALAGVYLALLWRRLKV